EGTSLLAFTATLYLGLAVLPVLALSVGRLPARGFWVKLVILLGAAGFSACFGEDLPYGGLFPYLDNMLTPWGQFPERQIVLGERPLLMGLGVRVGLTLLACAAGAALLTRASAVLRRTRLPGLLVLFSALHLGFLLISPVLFDRYLLVLLPGALY